MQVIYKSHIFLALAGYIFTSGYLHFIDKEEAQYFGLLIGMGTLLVYNLQQPRLEWIKKSFWLKYIFVVFLITVCSILAIGFIANGFAILCSLAALFFITIWYNYPVPFLKKSLRQISYIKIWLISFVWTAASSVVPFIGGNDRPDFNFVLAHFCLFFALALLFDERDRKSDDPNLHTIPQMIGGKSSKLLALVCFLVFAGILFFSQKDKAMPSLFWVLPTYFGLLLWLIQKENKFFFQYILIDNILIIIGLYYWIA